VVALQIEPAAPHTTFYQTVLLALLVVLYVLYVVPKSQ